MSLRSRCFRRLGHVLRKIEHPVIVIHFFPQRREGPGAISQLLDLDNRSYVFGVSAARSGGSDLEFGLNKKVEILDYGWDPLKIVDREYQAFVGHVVALGINHSQDKMLAVFAIRIK